MHPLLQNLSIFTWTDILESDETCASFLGNLGLIPEKTDSAPTCPKCSGSMHVRKHKGYALRWQWICQKHNSKENRCLGAKNPLDGTFFENTKMPIMDVVGVMFGYFLKINIKEMENHVNCWRKSRNYNQIISHSSVISLYARFKEIIFNALRKKGEFSESLEKADVRKLFLKYSKTAEVKPYFRNLVFQFLMDIKSEYPCLGSKVVIDTSASGSSSSASVDSQVKNKNGSNLQASTNVSLSSISSAVHRNESMNVEVAEITNSAPVITSAPITTINSISENSGLPSRASICKGKRISSAPVITSAPITTINSISENSRLPSRASVCIDKRISSVPVITSAPITTINSVSENSRLPSRAIVCIDQRISSAGGVTMYIRNVQTSNYNTVATANSCINNSTVFLENRQILNNSRSASVNIGAPIKITSVLGNAQISNSNAATIESAQSSIDNTTAMGMVQTSSSNLGTVSSPLSLSTDSVGKNFEESTNAGTDFFSDENMDIETGVIIKSEFVIETE